MTIRVAAPAKINLSLHVLGKRGDGFHEIRTVFQALDLADEVEVVRGGTGVELEVRGPDLGPLEQNLAYRAAELFLRASGERKGARIVLTKHVPAGAGLGGGSSDAAAVLRALVRGSSSRPDSGALMRLGARLGSDVPFFLGASPLARGLGRGELLQALPPLPPAHLVIALPPVHVSTAEAYAALGRAPLPATGEETPERPSRSEEEARSDEAGPATWDDVLRSLQNDFEPVVARRHPEVRGSLEALREAGARAVSLSGSGGACFGVFRDRGSSEKAADALTLAHGWPFVAARTLVRWPDTVGP